MALTMPFIVLLLTGLLTSCRPHDLRPGAGGQCGVDPAHPSANQGYAGNVCLIASFGAPVGPFREAMGC